MNCNSVGHQPHIVGLDRLVCFPFLVEIDCKVPNGWKETRLAFGAKNFFKAIAQEIPCYDMSIFKLPKQLC